MGALPSKLLKSNRCCRNQNSDDRGQSRQRCRWRRIERRCSDCRLLNSDHWNGAGRDRTDDPLLAKQVLSQLSYSPADPGGSGWIRTIDPRLIKTVL
jgi:hypothetical protein